MYVLTTSGSSDIWYADSSRISAHWSTSDCSSKEIDDVLDLVKHADAYRVEYNTVHQHEAIARNRPAEVHRGLVDPMIPNFPETNNLPTT